MKKALSVLTAAALVMSLAACGSSASSAASSEASGELTTVEAGKLIMATNATFPP